MEEKKFGLALYLDTKSLKTVQAKFCRKFSFNNFPQKFQIIRWVKKFKDTGILVKSTKKGQKSTSGRKLTARLPKNVDAVRDSVGRSPKKSLLKRSQKLGLCRLSVRRVLKKEILLYPYRIQIKQTFTHGDMTKHVNMCRTSRFYVPGLVNNIDTGQ